jgi:DNA-binding response OmpR family regulator
MANFPSKRGGMMLKNEHKQIVADGQRICWDDLWHKIEINGYSIHLSPTQYRICSVFLAHYTPSTISEEMIILAYRDVNELQHDVEMPSRHLLAKHISVLNARINTHGLHIQFFHQGYSLTLTASIGSSRSVR